MTRISDTYAENPAAILAHCESRQADGLEIDTDCARAICAQWHAGQSSAFYAFASSGHFDRSALLAELSDAFDHPRHTRDVTLGMLGTYLIARRGH